jgi:hypothetical protein
MKNVNSSAMYCSFALLLTVGATAQEVPVILHVELDNYVRYNEDVIDPARVARSAVPVTANPTANFGRNVVIADVTAVNGSPAKGVAVSLETGVFLNSNPTPGQAISDVVQGQFGFHEYDLLRPDGVRFGPFLPWALLGHPQARRSWVAAGPTLERKEQ